MIKIMAILIAVFVWLPGITLAYDDAIEDYLDIPSQVDIYADDLTVTGNIRPRFMYGTVEVQINGGAWQSPGEDIWLPNQGVKIHSGYKSSVQLEFDTGVIVKLGPMSLLTIDTPGSIMLLNGVLWVPPLDRAHPSDFKVKTPADTISVRGTEFMVSYEETTQQTFVAVVSGIVAVTPNDGSADAVQVEAEEEFLADSSGVGSVQPLSADTEIRLTDLGSDAYFHAQLLSTNLPLLAGVGLIIFSVVIVLGFAIWLLVRHRSR